MLTNEKAVNLIVKLNKLTALGELEWHTADAPRTITRGTDDFIPLYITARYKGQRFGLYQHRHQLYDGERDKLYWTERIVLIIIDSFDRVLWEYTNNTSALHDLFENVRTKISNIDTIIDDLLSDSSD